jgi:predicted negative regulator of RcsB-dependent stress response
VDQQTKAALKQDKFVNTTTHGLEWASEHRQSVIRTGAIILTAVVIAVVGAIVYNTRSDAASVAFGAAMQAYQTPLSQPGEPVPSGMKTYSSTAERAKAANALFQAIADKYGMTPSGRNALYFAGLTEIEAGQNQQAEDTLKKVADSWDSSLAGLAKIALAGLYRSTGRDQQAIDIYNQLAAKPTATVPSGLAQLQLADLYTAEGKTEEAKKVYATLKDKDAKGPAGAIAAEKLNPTPAPQPGAPPQ